MSTGEMLEALEAAVRAAKLALFVIRKQGVMPNSSWESGFNADLDKAEAALQSLRTETRQSPVGTVSTERDVAWLIERKNYAGGAPTRWYAESGNHGWHFWASDAVDAKRFTTKAEAETYPAYQMIANDPDISVTEHVFMRTETAQQRPTSTETNVNEQRTEGDSGMNRQG